MRVQGTVAKFVRLVPFADAAADRLGGPPERQFCATIRRQKSSNVANMVGD